MKKSGFWMTGVAAAALYAGSWLLPLTSLHSQPVQQINTVNYCGTGVFDAQGLPVVQPCGNSVTNVSESAASAATITLTPTATQFVYIKSIKVTNCAGASAVTAAAVTTITTTNLNGLTYQMGSGTTAGSCVQDFTDVPGGGGVGSLRAAASGAATVVLPTFATNQTIRVSVRWYSSL